MFVYVRVFKSCDGSIRCSSRASSRQQPPVAARAAIAHVRTLLIPLGMMLLCAAALKCSDDSAQSVQVDTHTSYMCDTHSCYVFCVVRVHMLT